MRFVAFLRGVNVGGNKKVPMGELKAAMEQMGYTNVQTLLNSGNVAFDGGAVDEKTVEAGLEKAFGFSIGVLVRSQVALKKLILSNPFDAIDVTKDTKLYVTFLKDLSATLKSAQPTDNSQILDLKNGAVFWYVQESLSSGTLDVMAYLEKEFGKDITTRNWNTVVKAAVL